MSGPRIAIIGAGIIGLYCAWRLALNGARVTVVEAEKEDRGRFGPAASLAAAGMLSPFGEAAHEGAAYLGLSLASLDLWAAHKQKASWRDAVAFSGGALIARDIADADAQIARAGSFGRRGELLTKGEWRKRTGLEAAPECGVFFADEATVDPAALIEGVLMDLRALGVRLLFSHEAEAIEPNLVRTFEGERIEADRVLIAPGAWGKRLAEVAPALARVSPAKGNLASVSTWRPLKSNVRGLGFYLARRPDGAVLLGSTMEPGRADRTIDHARIKGLLDAAERALPGQVRLNKDQTPWAGVRPMSPDGAPIIGPSGDVLVACGHSRNGWLLAPITAEIVCAHVFGEAIAPEWAPFASDRFAGD
ncbi:MAG: NAD(P)/FAD-dependent oxidoreductase [Hyphomonadaceae bacterium]